MHDEGSFAASIIGSSVKTLAAGIVDRHMSIEAHAADTSHGGQRALAMDTETRLNHLAEALAADRLQLFTDQLSWWKVWCTARGVSTSSLVRNLECMAKELEERLPARTAQRVRSTIQAGIDHLDVAPSEVSSYLEADGPHIGLARQFLLAVLETRETDAIQLIMDAFDSGIAIDALHEQVLTLVQREVGRMWQMQEITIAEEHYCTGIVSTAMTLMRSRAKRAEPNGRRVITTAVSDETHALGILLVTQAFEANGWTAINLGANTPADAIIDAARDFGCDVIALSVSLVAYVRRTSELIATLRTHEVTASIPILVGGQPFNLVEDLWQVVGADGCAATSTGSPGKAAQLLGG
jgi:MerR family transcriptional regulator, light-induced transcriptional regulator